MQVKNTGERYGLIAQLLHWTIAVLIVTQVVLASQAEDATSLLQKAKLLTTHKSIGMTVFLLAAVRLVWRLSHPAPRPVDDRGWQQKVASLVHWSLYALILVTPLAGWVMSSAKNYSVSWFGLFTWPNLVAPQENLAATLKTTHAALAKTMMVLVMLHAAAALKHHFIDRDNVLRRMLPVKLKVG
jgi:cytochrome b561